MALAGDAIAEGQFEPALLVFARTRLEQDLPEAFDT
jgi:hypothetical protein